MSIHAETIKPSYYDNAGIVTNQVLTQSHVLLGKLDGIFSNQINNPGYFNRLYLWSENFDKIDGLTIKNNGAILIDDVNPGLIKKSENLIEITLGHVNCGQTLTNLQIICKCLHNYPIQIEVYGKAQGIIVFE